MSTKLQLTGTVEQILELEKGVSPKGEWKRRSFILKTTDQYPKTVCFTTFNKVVDTVDSLVQGKEVTVHFYIESKEHNSRWYSQNTPWKIERTDTTVTNGNSTETPDQSEEGNDDLPF